MARKKVKWGPGNALYDWKMRHGKNSRRRSRAYSVKSRGGGVVRHRKSSRRGGFAMGGILKPAVAAAGGFFVGPIVKRMLPSIPFVDLIAGAGIGMLADGKRGAVIGTAGAIGGSMMGGGRAGNQAQQLNG